MTPANDNYLFLVDWTPVYIMASPLVAFAGFILGVLGGGL